MCLVIASPIIPQQINPFTIVLEWRRPVRIVRMLRNLDLVSEEAKLENGDCKTNFMLLKVNQNTASMFPIHYWI